MDRCVFNEIVEGNIPAYRVYEDDSYLAFLDIFPRTKGHTLVIPKTQYRWVYEVPDFAGYWQTVHRVTQKIQSNLKPQWVNYFTHGSIPYAHIHILPRYTQMSEDAPVTPKQISLTKEEFEDIARIIRGE